MNATAQKHRLETPKYRFSNSSLLTLGYATVFFPRLLTYFGAPAPINFVHLIIIPFIFFIVIFRSGKRDYWQVNTIKNCFTGLLILLIIIIASAALNFAGIINIFLQYILLIEPYLLLIAILSTPFTKLSLKRFRNIVLGFGFFNLILAIAQFFLIPVGLFPSSGQLLTDNTAGVFVANGGSAGNYISCAVSIYYSLYFFLQFTNINFWLRGFILFLAAVQTQISDSKQVFLAMLMGWFALSVFDLKNLRRSMLILIGFILVVGIFIWSLYNVEGEYLDHYRNWTIGREGLYGLDGVATLTKTAAFRIIPTYYTSPLNWLLGLGPGHSVTWLGGWLLDKYSNLLVPLGATIHPASATVFQVVYDGWIAQESTVYFPLFTWAGIWGDFGFVGLGSYIFLCSIIWRKVCVDAYTKFLLLSTGCFGFILTQMEEPGHMLTVALLLGIRWQESRLNKKDSLDF